MPTYTCALDKNVAGYQDFLYKYSESSESDVRTPASPDVYNLGGGGTAENPCRATYRAGYTSNKYPPVPDAWEGSQWHTRYDTSAIPIGDTVTTATLSQTLTSGGSSARTVQIHGINWTYSTSVSGVSGTYPGTQASNWKNPSAFTNSCFSFSTGTGTVSLTGNANARAWINKGGFTYFVAVDAYFISGGFPDQETTAPVYVTRTYSSLTVITTAGATPVSAGWGLILK